MKSFCKIGLNIVLLLIFQEASGQIKYWVEFADKGPEPTLNGTYVSEKTYQQRATLGLPQHPLSDVPVYAPYTTALQGLGVQPLVTSRWLNAVSAELSPTQAHAVASLPFVTSVTPFRGAWHIAATDPVDSLQLSVAVAQLQGEAFLRRGINGQGVAVGIIDAGFLGANSNRHLTHATEGGKVAAWRDWQTPTRTNIYGERETGLDWHGATVWEMVAGYDSTDNSYTGLAPNATFYLARTEHGDREYRGEQDLWIAALEWLDSCGVRLVNTSLGYSRGFDDPEENYNPDIMDGRTVIAKGVKIAALEKGMILVISAGNDGNDITWQYLSTPAEVQEVISVGATYQGNWLKQGYSGIGPPYLDFVKPDVSAFSNSGTSFSAPVIMGLVAGMLQLDSTLTPARTQWLLQNSSHLAALPNNYLGYGVPNCEWLYQALTTGDTTALLPAPCQEVAVPDGESAFTLVPEDHGLDRSEHHQLFWLKGDRRTVSRQAFAEGGAIPEEFVLQRGQENARYTHITNLSGTCWVLRWGRPQVDKGGKG